MDLTDGLDLDSLLQAVGLQSQKTAQTSAQVSGNYEQIKQLGEQRALAASTQGEDDAIVEQQKQAGELQAQTNARTFATAAGTNMDVSSEIMTSLGTQLREAQLESIRAQKVVQDKSKVGLFDDPIQYIMNQITLGDDINYADQAQGEADKISNALATLNRETTDTAKAQNAIAATKSAASMAAAVDAVKQKAIEQSSQIQQQTAIYNVDGLMRLQQLKQEDLGNLFNARNAVVQDKHLEIAQQQLQETVKMREIQMQDRLDKINDRQQSQEQNEMYANYVRKGLSNLYGADIAPPPTNKIISLLKANFPLYKSALTSGMASEAAGMNVIATNPGDAAVTIAQTKAPLSSAMQPVRDLMTGVLDQMASGQIKTANGMQVNMSKPEEVASVAGQNIVAIAGTQAKNIKIGDNTNIYQAPPISSIVDAVPAIKDTQLYQKVLAPLVQTGMADTNPTQIMNLAATAIKNGTLDFKTASDDVGKLFDAAVRTNNVTKDYLRVGIKPQNTYNTTVTASNVNTPGALQFMTDQHLSVNMLDAVSRESALNKILAAKRDKSFPSIPGLNSTTILPVTPQDKQGNTNFNQF